MTETGSLPPQDPHAVTTLHVQRAIDGDGVSLAWLVARLSPLLRAQAAYRLGPELRALHDPDDLVQDVWLLVLPRLSSLQPRAGRITPVLLCYMATALLHRVRNLSRKYLTGKPVVADLERVAAPAHLGTGVVTSVVRRERNDEVTRCLQAMAPADREILVLRGIEQQSTRMASLLLGVGEDAIAKRYQRALARLRQALPRSVFDELDDA